MKRWLPMSAYSGKAATSHQHRSGILSPHGPWIREFFDLLRSTMLSFSRNSVIVGQKLSAVAPNVLNCSYGLFAFTETKNSLGTVTLTHKLSIRCPFNPAIRLLRRRRANDGSGHRRTFVTVAAIARCEPRGAGSKSHISLTQKVCSYNQSNCYAEMQPRKPPFGAAAAIF